MEPYEEMEWLIHEGVSLSLVAAIFKGNLDEIQEVLADRPYSVDDWRPGYTLASLTLKMQEETMEETIIAKLLIDNLLEVYSRQRLSYVDLLHFAAIRGDKEMIDFLVIGEVHVDATDGLGRTALQYAIINGNATSVRCLLLYGANRHAKDNDGYSAIYHSIIQNNSKIIQIVLERNLIQVTNATNARDVEKKYYEDNVAKILELEYSRNKDKMNGLKDAVCGNEPICEFIVESFLKYGFILTPDDLRDTQFLITAIQKGYLEIVKAFLDLGADVNKLYQSSGKYERTTLLHVAVSSKQLQIARLLIKYRANVNAKDSMKETPLFEAVRNDDVRMLKLLLNNYVKTGDEHELLLIPFKKKRKETIEILSKHIDINCKDEAGRTLLHLCTGSYGSDLFMLEFLLKTGANVCAKNVQGVTPLHKAVRYRQESEVLMLLRSRADVNAVDNERATPMHDCVTIEDVYICRLLLMFRANVNSKDKKGETPLHLAVTKGNLNISSLLLFMGADVNCRDLDGRTALHRAIGDINMAEFLLDYEADVS